MPSLIEKINSIVPEDLLDRHSFFQLKYFVIGKEPTIQGQINACRRELASRRESLFSLELELESECDKLGELVKQEKEQSGRQKREMNRSKKLMERQIDRHRKKLQAIEQECMFLIDLYEKLLTKEEPKDWDDFEVQMEYWNARLMVEMQSRLALGQPLTTEVAKTIMSLPDKVPIKQKLIGLIESRKQEETQLLSK